ncbi:hydantoinase/oxoprolinase family protein [Bordetella genomosp. 10]|nr:hydantoinase/oxoprolinase family protein [Bordetella genomosp. 10]
MNGTDMQCRMGVDIGGTFTDIVLVDGAGTIYSKKVLSTPHDYSEAIEDGVRALLDELKMSPASIREFAHATTVATNTIIERKGVRAALVTTKGFRDVLELGRFRTPRLYDIEFRKPEPLIERRLRFEVEERTAADGAVLAAVREQDLEDVARAIEQEGAEAVAVAFINAYANPQNERHALEYLSRRLPGVAVSASTALLPQIGEYERTSTTVVNAYVRPVVERYVDALQSRLDRMEIRAPLGIMQSSGGMAPGAVVAQRPIYIIESGPAAGVLGGQRMAERAGLGDTIVFDMGGTTAKATIIVDNQFMLCPETEVGGGAALGQRMVKGGGFPVQVPTIDIAEVGAGGGSIAALDAAGGIQVGPRSAGAAPGPICYDRGGKQPTVTDANLILGYLNPGALVGGELSLAYDKARAAIAELAQRLDVSLEQAAYGIHLIANATMLRALRGVSSEKGMDPSQFALFAIGGNGPVHAATLAESAGMNRCVIPPVAGLFSALGMLFADVEHQLVGAFYRRFADVDAPALQEAIDALANEGESLLASEGYGRPEQRSIEIRADVKYAGQTSPLSVTLPGVRADDGTLPEVLRRFEAEHQRTFGYVSPGEPLQFVSIKAVCRGIAAAQRMPASLRREGERRAPAQAREAYFGPEHGWMRTPVATRADLAGKTLQGPVIIEEYDTTSVVRPGWSARLDAVNNIVLER